MKVLCADAMGMCFGVQRALESARGQPDPQAVTIWGELVHNEGVVAELASAGFECISEVGRDELPERPVVLITPHGVSAGERERLRAPGRQLVDTTCPFVRRLHDVARRLEDDGFKVVVIGRPGHVEVTGVIGDLRDPEVIAEVADVSVWKANRIAFVAQTTTRQEDARAIVRAARQLNPEAEVVFVDTICDPTRQRILALEFLVTRCDAVVVVGGRHSNNTAHLAALSTRRGVPAFHVQGAGDLLPQWFQGMRVVGLTAGTSTPSADIEAVRVALEEMPSDLDLAV